LVASEVYQDHQKSQIFLPFCSAMLSIPALWMAGSLIIIRWLFLFQIMPTGGKMYQGRNEQPLFMPP
jgi:hypothetical protein